MSNSKHTGGTWSIGKIGGVVVSTVPSPGTENSKTGHSDPASVKHYGGCLIAESIWNPADARVMAAAPSMLNLLEEFVENVYVPDANCSCHLAPPCSDCVEHGHIREILGNAKALIAEVKGDQS